MIVPEKTRPVHTIAAECGLLLLMLFVFGGRAYIPPALLRLLSTADLGSPL